MQKFLQALLLLCFTTILSAQHWELSEMAPMPERVSNNAVCEGFINGEPYVYSFAGIDSTKIWSGIHLKSFRYSVNDNLWETIEPLPAAMTKIAASASRVGDIIYIIGGYHVFAGGSEVSSDEVHRYDIVNNTYLTDGAAIPKAIDDQTQGVWRDSLIYVVTGWSDFGNVTNVQIYNPAEDSWAVGTPIPNDNDYKSFGSSGTIIGDTIYYFGGATSSGNFPIQNDFRIGIINPEDPTEITWSKQTFGVDVNGYRIAAAKSKGKAFWVGGSSVSYNFNGIAYNGSGGVPPANRSLYYEPETGMWEEDFSTPLPMDLRSLAEINDTVKFIVGGMLDDQWVSNKTWRLDSDVTQFVVPAQEIPSEEIILSPNPATDFLEVNLLTQIDLSPTRFTIVDVNGVQVRNGDFKQGEQINIRNLSAGVYFLNLYDGTRRGYAMFLKM